MVGLTGLLTWMGGAALEPQQAFFSYLAALAYTLSVALGALVLLMAMHLIRARWFVALRRLTETVAVTLPLLAILFLPLLFGLDVLYPWAAGGALPAEARTTLAEREPYLNVPFFLFRAALYFAVWTTVAFLLCRWSLGQHRDVSGALARRQQILSALALPLVVFALTFAAFDWLMSLSWEWGSSIWGVYYFAGGLVAALGLLAIAAFGLQSEGSLRPYLESAHFYALASVLLASTLFWTYAAYSQYLTVWMADIPREVAWYVPRVRTTWAWLAVALLVGHLALPVPVLLSWRLKRRPGVVAATGAWLVLVHYLDIYWMVLPSLHPEGVRPHWLDLAALLGIAGSAAAFALWRLRAHPVVALGDPLLESSLEYATRGVAEPARRAVREAPDA